MYDHRPQLASTLTLISGEFGKISSGINQNVELTQMSSTVTSLQLYQLVEHRTRDSQLLTLT